MAANERSAFERLLPEQSVPDTEPDARMVTLEDTDAESVFDVLASDTSREVLVHLYDEPGTASDLADRVDTSQQNIHYHLTRLQEAGLINEIDTWYSSRGVEMTVYGPSNEPLVLFAGNSECEVACRDAVDEEGSKPAPAPVAR